MPLIARIIAQRERRVLSGEAVPASEKLVSLFEPHADIIRKGGRQVQYGHKLNLATGESGLTLDVVIEAGNPADVERLPQEVRHRRRRHGQEPLGLSPAAQLPRGDRGRISCFKRAYGAARCTWRGLDHFKAYIWSAAAAHYLVLLARLKPL